MNRPAKYAWFIILILVPSGLVVRNYLRTQGTQSDETPPAQGDITIGVLIDYYRNIPAVQAITSYAEEEINRYCDETGAQYTFNFQVTSAEGRSSIALEKIQFWHESGVDLVIGPPWSSMVCVSISYADHNGMILFSHVSTSPQLAVDDNGFRLTITDIKEAQVLVWLLEEAGIDSALILERGDSWAGGIADEIESIYDGEIKRFRYAATTRKFTEYVAEADLVLRQMEGENKAVVSLCFDEMAKLVNATTDHPAMTRLPWFTTSANLNSTYLNDLAPQISRMDMTGFAPIIPKSTTYDELNQLYGAEINETLGYYTANIYDICWLYALAVIETGNTEAADIKETLPEVAASYKGVTGNCALDSYGDRNTSLYGIYRYVATGDSVYAEKIDEISVVFAEVSMRGSVH